jgi:acetylornithine/N-succinyldiaminopimelate aminotransferase
MSAASSTTKPAASSGPSPAVMGTYGRFDVVFDRGEGSWLIDTKGERYLDFGSGIAVNALGHANPKLAAALAEQAQKLWHTSNLYRIAGQEKLAERLVANTFADKVFFGNSGAEACEGIIKLARRYQFVSGHPERWRIITFKGSFHGRTLATIAAAGNEKYLEGFGEPAPGFDILETVNDLALVEKAIGPATAAIMVEPIQGEGGIRVCTREFMQGLRALADKHGLLLILDEVQTGVGRTGKLFAYELSGIKPDAMAIAKAIGGGFPMGAFLATEEAAKGMVPGTHGSTFGGNPLAMAVGNAVLETVLEPDFMEGVQRKALRFKQLLARVQDEHADVVEEIRGEGLLTGVKINAKLPAGDVVKACLAEHLLTVGAGDNVVRMIPPLTTPDEELAEGVARLSRALSRAKKPQ